MYIDLGSRGYSALTSLLFGLFSIAFLGFRFSILPWIFSEVVLRNVSILFCVLNGIKKTPFPLSGNDPVPAHCVAWPLTFVLAMIHIQVFRYFVSSFIVNFSVEELYIYMYIYVYIYVCVCENVFKTKRPYCYQWFRVSTRQAMLQNTVK